MNQPDLCILDTTTLDGALAAWALRQRWPTLVIVPEPYEWSKEDPETGAEGLTPSVLMIGGASEAGLTALAASARWLHVCANSGEEVLKAMLQAGILKYSYAGDQSAAALAWHYAMGDGRMVPRLIQYSSDQKMGIETADGPEILLAASTYDMDEASLGTLIRMCEDPAKRLVLHAEGRAIRRYVGKHQKEAAL